MPLLAVSAHDIDIAGQALEADLPTAWLAEELSDAQLTADEPGRAAVRLSRSGNEIIVRGRVKAELATPCARCLAPAKLSVDTELTLLLRPAPGGHHPKPAANGKAHAAEGKKDPHEEEYEFTSEEADVDYFDGETVVLDPFVREAILLEVPNFPLCSEDCAGIQPAPDAAAAESEPRIDPRLAPLSALREKLAGSAKRPSRPPGKPAASKTPKKKAKKE